MPVRAAPRKSFRRVWDPHKPDKPLSFTWAKVFETKGKHKMSLTFYYAPYSTAVATHWVLEELAVPYEKVRIDIAKRDQDKPDFRVLNPNGKVPTLVHDGVAIFESAAIAAHLGEQFGVAKRLYPEPGPRRGKALQWLVWTNVSLAHAIAMHQHAKDKHEGLAALAKEEVDRLFKILDDHLATKPWMLGEQFSLVDAHLGAFVSYAGMVGFPATPYEHVADWLGRLTSRPAFAESHKP